MRHFIVFLLFFSSITLFSQSKVVYLDKDQLLLNPENLTIKVSDNSPAKFIELLKSGEIKFEGIPNSMLNFGFERRDIWLKCTFKNPYGRKIQRLLKFNNPNLDYIEIFQRNGQKFKQIAIGGDQIPFKKRFQGNRELVFPIKFDAFEFKTVYIRLNNGGEQFFFETSIENENLLNEQQNRKQAFFGALFGIMLFILLLNLFIGVIFKLKIAFLYSGYAATFILLQLSLLGFGTMFFWQDEFFISNRANPILASSSVLFFLHFTLRYLQVEKITPKLYKWVVKSQYVLLFNLILSFIPGEFFMFVSAILVNALTLILNLIIIYPLYHAVKQKFKPAYSYLLGFSILQIAVFAFILRNFGIIPNSFLAENGLQLGSGVEMIILTFGILQRFKIMNDESIFRLEEANKLKEDLNVQLEIEVTERTKEVIIQKNELEFKNEEITSSIEYAKRIQTALLPKQNELSFKNITAAINYEPKDIVAGDFYWKNSREFNNEMWHFYAVADCTGHGVPGAMMSVLCMNALNSSLEQLESLSTSELLERTCDILLQFLNSEKQHLSDGMDISIIAIQIETRKINWSGANNPLWYLHENVWTEIPPTKRPIGKSDITTPFTQFQFDSQEKVRFLLFTDGCIDQFGGINGKKLKTKGFRSFVHDSSTLSVTEQSETIKNNILNWRNEDEQTDDICFMIIEF